MRGIFLKKLGKRIKVTKGLEIPVLKEEEKKDTVILRMKRSPVHPADIYFMRGIYGDNKPMPCIPGFEGFGEVIQGPDHLIGKFSTSLFFDIGGSFQEFSKAEISQSLFFEKSDVEKYGVEQLAGCLMNPLTAYGMLSKIEEGTGVIQTASASHLGQIFTKKCLKKKIAIVNVIRREEQSELLLKNTSGFDQENHIVLNENSESFKEELKKYIKEFNIKTCFEAISGEMTSKIFPLLPEFSTLHLLGSLSLKPVLSISPIDLIARGKVLRGFHLRKNYLNCFENLHNSFIEEIKEDLDSGIITAEYGHRIRLGDLEDAIRELRNEGSTGNKILIEFE